MTVEELLARISSRELAEWRAYEQEYGPLGLERGDWQAAQVVHAVSGGKGSRLADFVLRWSRGRKQSGAEQLAIFKALGAKEAED